MSDSQTTVEAGDCRIVMYGFDARRVEVWTGDRWLDLRGVEVESVLSVGMRPGGVAVVNLLVAICAPMVENEA